MKPKILAFSGSCRSESLNKKLIHNTCQALQAAGGDVTLINLKDYPLPLYDGDLEQTKGLPENAHKLKKLFLEHQGLVLACPEYNSSITPLLKNTIDWISRPIPEEKEYLICFKNKLAALVSASPGALGGLRGLVVVRSLLQNIGVMVFPDQLAFPKADEKFDANGLLTDSNKQKALKQLMLDYVNTLHKLHL